MPAPLPLSRNPRWLVDENLPAEVAVWLIAAGFDATRQSLLSPSQPDPGVLDGATAAGRIVVTQDTDFGDLVHRDRLPCRGVVLLRMGRAGKDQILRRLEQVEGVLFSKQPGTFIVVDPAKIRVRPLPQART